MRVHVQRGRTRRVHVIHAPVPVLKCRDVADGVAARNLPARAGAHGSPPFMVENDRATWLVHVMVVSFLCNPFELSFISKG